MVIQEQWTPELSDSTTDEFNDLANVYIDAFKKSFSQDGTSKVGTSIFSFAEVRVVGFILDDSLPLNDSSFR